jgi:hypothetical protein
MESITSLGTKAASKTKTVTRDAPPKSAIWTNGGQSSWEWPTVHGKTLGQNDSIKTQPEMGNIIPSDLSLRARSDTIQVPNNATGIDSQPIKAAKTHLAVVPVSSFKE